MFSLGKSQPTESNFCWQINYPRTKSTRFMDPWLSVTSLLCLTQTPPVLKKLLIRPVPVMFFLLHRELLFLHSQARNKDSFSQTSDYDLWTIGPFAKRSNDPLPFSTRETGKSRDPPMELFFSVWTEKRSEEAKIKSFSMEWTCPLQNDWSAGSHTWVWNKTQQSFENRRLIFQISVFWSFFNFCV